MRKTEILCSLILFGVPLITVFSDTVDFRIADENIVWRIDRSCDDARMACTGSFHDLENDSLGLTLCWKEAAVGRLKRAGVLREIAGPFSLSAGSEAFHEESGYKPDFSLEPVKGWGAALRVPMRSGRNAARMGTMMYKEYSCFWLFSSLYTGCTMFEPFIVISLTGDGIEDELVSTYASHMHSDPLVFSGLHIRTVEEGCGIDLLISRAESAVGTPGMFFRYQFEMGRDNRDGFNCKLLARWSCDSYPAIDGSHVSEEADLQVRAEYADATWRIFAGGGLLREKEAAVPHLYIGTDRSLTAGFRIDGDRWNYSYTAEYREECDISGEHIASGGHGCKIEYSRLDWWMSFSVSMSDSGEAPAVDTDGEFGFRILPFVLRIKAESDGRCSLRLDYSSRAKSEEKTAGFLCMYFDSGEDAAKMPACTSITIGWKLWTE